MPSLETLAVLRDEVAEVVDGMSAALGDLSASSNTERLREALEFFTEQIVRIKMASDILGLTGLKAACTRVTDNLNLLREADGSHEALACFMRGPNLILDYLRAPKDPATHAALRDYLANAYWPSPIGAMEAAALVTELGDVDDSSNEPAAAPARPTRAEPQDVSLDVADDVNPALVEAFLAESPQQAGAYTSLIEQVVRGGADVEMLHEARRLVHSIKGAANTIGMRGIATLTHHLEDVLDYLNERAMKPGKSVAKLLMDAADCLEMMFESLAANEPPPALALPLLQRLLDAANAIDRGDDVDTVEAAPLPVPDANVPAAATPQTHEPADVSNDAPRAAVTPKARIAIAAIEEMLRLSGEMTIGRAHVQERLHQAFAVADELHERHGALRTRAHELDRLVTIQGVAAGQKQGPASKTDSEFDALELDQYSELHGAVHGFVETIADTQALQSRMLDMLSALESAIAQEGLINNELHENIMRTRMVEAATIEPRLARTVRQACDATGKEATLVFSGGDVMLDDSMVNQLVSPLTHLLRNAVDHGLESPEAREMLGKPRSGTIRLGFAREGNNIVIRSGDDGEGLDLPCIRAIAVDRGLIAPDVTLDDSEIARFILLPGFSTRDEVTETSGRGVGMDVVNVAVQKLKGTLDIATEPGQGTTFTLRLPMSLGTAHCLVVRAGGELVAIPTDVLDRAIYQGAKNIQRFGERHVYREERESFEVHDLAHLLGRAKERSLGDAEDDRPVIVINDADGKKALVTDALLSGRDLVIKNLGRFLARAPGMVGASVLGDGSVVPVLDLRALLRMRGGTTAEPMRPYLVHSRVEAREARTSISILVVDDSFTVRQTMQSLLTGEGYEVVTARDGAEALEYVTKTPPAAVVTDLEMPRMNGLDFVSRTRANEATRALPIIMVTSRSSEKHRQQAQLAGVDCYLTKPFQETELLTQLQTMLRKNKVA